MHENAPGIDVDVLAARIAGKPANPRAAADSSLEDLLIVAEARAAIRTSLPGRLAFAPFAHPLVRRAILGILSFVSRDQRRVNLALIDALREASAVQRALEDRVRALEARER